MSLRASSGSFNFPAPRLPLKRSRVNDWVILDSRLDDVPMHDVVRKRKWRLIE